MTNKTREEAFKRLSGVITTPVVCVKNDATNDCYAIEHKDPNLASSVHVRVQAGFALMCSARITDVDVEGTAYEMLRIAKAIILNDEYAAIRCAVDARGDIVKLWSPRKSQHAAETTRDVADALALQICELIRAENACALFEVSDEWAKSAIGKTEREITDAVIVGGGSVRVATRNGIAEPIGHFPGCAASFFPDCECDCGAQKLVANRANLVVANDIVVEVTFG